MSSSASSSRIAECLLCGMPFAVTPRHPAVESAHCPSCWAVIAERLTLGVDQWGIDWARVPALRSWQV